LHLDHFQRDLAGVIQPVLRFQEAVEHFDMGDRSPVLENAFYLFKAIFDPKTEPPTFDSQQQSFA